MSNHWEKVDIEGLDKDAADDEEDITIVDDWDVPFGSETQEMSEAYEAQQRCFQQRNELEDLLSKMDWIINLDFSPLCQSQEDIGFLCKQANFSEETREDLINLSSYGRETCEIKKFIRKYKIDNYTTDSRKYDKSLIFEYYDRFESNRNKIKFTFESNKEISNFLYDDFKAYISTMSHIKEQYKLACEEDKLQEEKEKRKQERKNRPSIFSRIFRKK